MKLIILLGACLLCSINIYAQDTLLHKKKQITNKNALIAGYGYATREYLLAIPTKKASFQIGDSSMGHLNMEIARKLFGANKYVDFNNLRTAGALAITYRRQLLPALAVGVTAAYERNTKDLHIGGQQVGLYKRDALTIAGECQGLYKRKGIITYYGSIGLGSTLFSEQFSSISSVAKEVSNGNYFAFQLVPFGIMVGKRLNGYGEIGVGYKGILNVGAAYRF